jgi:hypothetical protein
VKISLPAAVLLWALPHLATAQVAILHIQVIEGDGAVNPPGARSARPLAVEVTDETGKPVEGAAVSFHLPEDGPGGNFGNGLRTAVIVSDARGRASLHSLQLNRIPGRVEIRIVAAKEQARAGMVAFQYIAAPKGGEAPASSAKRVSRGTLKWIVLAAVAGGAAAVGTLAASRSNGTAAAAVSPPAISIGSPSLMVGKP